MQTDLIDPFAPVAAPASPPPDAAPPPAAAPTTEQTPPVKEPTVLQRSLTLVKNTVKEFDAAEAGLARLRKKYENVVFDVSTTKGMKEATDARMAIRDPRYAVKTALDAAKKPLNALKADITARAEALIAEIMKLETPIHEQIVAEEKRKADEREARETADRARILAITERIASIRQMGTRASECRTAARVNDILTALLAVDLTGFDEFENEAIAAHTATTQTVTNIHNTKVADEAEREERRLAQVAEDARLKEAADALAAQQAELARQQKELADQQAAFQAQKAAAVQTFQQAAAVHEAKPLPADPTPAQVALHELGEAAVAVGNALVEELQAPQGVEWKAPAPGDSVSHQAQVDGYRFVMGESTATEDDTAAVSAGFDAAMRGSGRVSTTTPELADPSDQEVVDVAIDAVAMYFGISEQDASTRLAAIRQWTYQGHALAA